MTNSDAIALLDQELTSLRARVEVQNRAIEAFQQAFDAFDRSFGVPSSVTVGPKLRPKLRKRPPSRQAAPQTVPTQSHPWWPAVPLLGKALPAPPGAGCYTLGGSGVSVIAISVLGLEGAALEDAVVLASRRQRASMNFVPVFLTEAPDFEVFRRRGYAFEYFPVAAYGPEQESLHFQFKLLMIWRKWNISGLIDLGPAGHLASRLEDVRLAELAAAIGSNSTRSKLNATHERGEAPASGSTGEKQQQSGRRERSRQRQSRHIKFLKARLELGFEAEALDELRRYLDSPIEPEVRHEAAWMLALWHLNRDDGFESAVAAYQYLSLLGHLSPERSRETAYTILLVESLVRLGRVSDARAACLSAWERNQTPDLALAMSNVLLAQDPEGCSDTTDASRLVWINRAFENRLGFRLSKRDQAQALSMDNATVDARRLGGNLPLVSVIMPAYNSDDYIATAVESVLNQTWHNLELIIVDDASVDSTPEIIRAAAAKDRRIRILTNQRNMGPGFSRSVALREAAGHLVTCQDADDWGHPRKIEMQALHLLSDSSAVANMSEHVRTSAELGFSRRGRAGFYIEPYISSLMFRREEVLQTIGFWDSVRFAEDAEFFKRMEACFGRDAVARPKTGPVLFARVHDQQQTSAAVTGYRGYNYGARAEYAEAYEIWHRKARGDERGLRVGFPQLKRPFAAPLVMISPPEEQPHRFDVVIASDFRMYGGSTNSSAEEIEAQRAAGLRTGLMHIPRYDHNPSNPIADKIRDLVDGEAVHLLVYGDRILSDLVIFRWPPALAHVPAFLPDVKAHNLRMILNQTPQRRRGDDLVFYDIEAVDRNAATLFDRKGVWAPIGPEARAVLEPHAGRVEISGDDWVNILNLDEAQFRSDRPENPKPVIGRHARDHPDKWPGTVEELLSAYPDSPDLVVSILGGAEVPREVLGVLPRNWTVAPFDNMHPYKFLRTLDVFVYYPHGAYIEAFGRVILEAMAIGVPVLLPESFRVTFGGAASYAPISDVEQAVWKLLQDDRLYADQARRGREFVEKGFGHDAHIRRIAGMVARLKQSPLHVGG